MVSDVQTRPGDQGTVAGDEGGAARCSVLFRDGEGSTSDGAAQPGPFRDLNLDQVIDGVFAGREDYDLTGWFHEPLRDLDAVVFRQEVFEDLGDGQVRARCRDFAAVMGEVRRELAFAARLRNRYERAVWHLQAAERYVAGTRALAEGLGTATVRSRGLAAFVDHLAGYVASGRFAELADGNEEVARLIAGVRYRLQIEGPRITVTRYEGEDDYSPEVLATFDRFRQGAASSYLEEYPDTLGLDHIEAGVLDRVAKLHPEAFDPLLTHHDRHQGFIDPTVAAFDREIQFYLAYLDYLDPLVRAGLPVCQPEVTDPSQGVSVVDMFDLALARQLVADDRPVVTNDLELAAEERIVVVTGANQGGKTTFARTLGQLHHLASLGCPVPGRHARMGLCDRVFAHFAREETLQDLHGQLQDDLVRVHEILTHATGDSLLVVNELFSSTTLADARELGTRILTEVARLGARCVYVTFIDELSRFDQRTVSMVATVDPHDPAVRTFQVVRQPADGLAHALAIADKYGLTHQQLRERMAR